LELTPGQLGNGPLSLPKPNLTSIIGAKFGLGGHG